MRATLRGTAIIFSLGVALALLGGAALRLSLRPSPAAHKTVSSPLSERPVAPLFSPALAPSLLETPARDRWQKPAQIVRALQLRPGGVVADIGSGSGYLLPYLSRAVGPKGIVYAEEIQEDFLPALQRRAAALGNVRVVQGLPDDPRLPAGTLDCFVLLTVYHEVQQPVAFLRKLRSLSRADTRLAILDFDARRKGDPPAPQGHELPEATVIAEARQAGWELCARHEFLSSQFFLVFRPCSR